MCFFSQVSKKEVNFARFLIMFLMYYVYVCARSLMCCLLLLFKFYSATKNKKIKRTVYTLKNY